MRPRAKSYYWQHIGSPIRGIDWYQNEWPWPLFRSCLRSCQPLCHIGHWVSRKPFNRLGSKGPPIGNAIWRVEWSRERWRHVTPKGQTRDSNTLWAQYLENSWRCYSNNSYLLDSLLWGSTVGYPIATAWLLVLDLLVVLVIQLATHQVKYFPVMSCVWSLWP